MADDRPSNDSSTLLTDLALRVIRELPEATFQDVVDAWNRATGRRATGPEVDRLWRIYNDASPTLTRIELAAPVEAPPPATEPTTGTAGTVAATPTPSAPPVQSAPEPGPDLSGPGLLGSARRREPLPPPTRARGVREMRAKIKLLLDPEECAPGVSAVLPPLAGWPARVAAFVIDCFALAVVGQLVGLLAPGPLVALGPYGRMVGFAIAWLYLGVCASALTGGQTLGKRALGIAVRGRGGAPIGAPRALVRSALVAAPLVANGFELPTLSADPLSAVLQGALVLGLGFGGVAFAFANRRRRQALHDVVCQTRVIRLAGAPVVAYPQAPRGFVRRSLPAAAIFITLAGASLALGWAGRATDDSLRHLEQAIAEDSRLRAVKASMAADEAGGAPRRVLEIEAWSASLPSDEAADELATQLARRAGADYDAEADVVRVTLLASFDIGLAHQTRSWTVSLPGA